MTRLIYVVVFVVALVTSLVTARLLVAVECDLKPWVEMYDCNHDHVCPGGYVPPANPPEDYFPFWVWREGVGATYTDIHEDPGDQIIIYEEEVACLDWGPCEEGEPVDPGRINFIDKVCMADALCTTVCIPLSPGAATAHTVMNYTFGTCDEEE
jgi:hypothetical protein